MATRQSAGRTTGPAPSKGPVTLLIGTRKGTFFVAGDRARRAWKTSAPMHLGHVVNHVVLDPRDRRTIVAAVRAGHLGPTIFRSTDRGRTWKEATRPPAFPKVPEGPDPGGKKGPSVHHTFWLSPGLPQEKDTWWAGSSPPGLFRSSDGGVTWEGVEGFNAHPQRPAWVGEGDEGPPDGATMHSVLVDPRDGRHMYVGISAGGVFETRDGGRTWAPLNRGCSASFLPDPKAPFGHDPHRVALHPARPDRLWQQNHEGIYTMDRAASTWTRVGENMPKKVGDIGFPIVLHPRDPDTAWVFPMDGQTVWPRVCIDGKPASYVTRDAGASWKRLDKGFPRAQAWWTVKRQSMARDTRDPVGVYLGTTSGEVWGSRDEGATWHRLAQHLPEVYSVEVAEFSG